MRPRITKIRIRKEKVTSAKPSPNIPTWERVNANLQKLNQLFQVA